MKQSQITLNGQVFTYVTHRKKIKNIYFRVKEDLIIHVSANRLVSDGYLEDLLTANADAIIRLYAQAKKKKSEELSYLGNPLTYYYEEVKPYLEHNSIYGRSLEEVQHYLYRLAPSIFTIRLNRLREQFNNLPEFTLKVRKMKSKWGVCNHRSMSITLNSELIKKDVHLIDYVIIHELCHFKYMNHSKEYWAYVGSFYPYYKTARKELKY